MPVWKGACAFRFAVQDSTPYGSCSVLSCLRLWVPQRVDGQNPQKDRQAVKNRQMRE